MKSRAADGFHPAVSFAYALSLALMAMLFFHPVFIVLGLFFAVLQVLILRGGKFLLRQLAFTLPFCLVVALFNPIINSGGKTLLFYLFGNPVTLEATLYGLCSGAMLLLIFLWFGVYNRLVPPERFLYLFSRFAPAASLLVTMTQRMIPMFTRRLANIAAVQKTLCVKADGARRARFQSALHEISILLSWSMEDGLDTADSMKARGYGGRHRSSFSVFAFTARDLAALCMTVSLTAVCAAFYYTGATADFFPRIRVGFGTGAFVSAGAYLLLGCALPLSEARFALLWSRKGLYAHTSPAQANP